MHLERYAVVLNSQHTVYDFLSEGPRGIIKKRVLYEEIGENIFNLGFGDWDENTRKLDDSVRSNNNDRDKILATVAATVIDFMCYHPNAIIFARGFTPSRTRLYQIGIHANFGEISKLFDIAGFREGKWEPFRKGRNYEMFSLEEK